MFFYLKFLLMLLMLLLLKLGNGLNQHAPNGEILPFNLSHNRFIALQGVSLEVSQIDYESHTLYAKDPKDCLPRLFLNKLHNSSIYPFQFYPWDFYPRSPPFNITFFDCSDCSSVFLNDQNMSVCPIVAVYSDDSILKRPGLVFCTKVARLLSPIPAGDLRYNTLSLKWFPPKSEDEKHKKMLIIVLPTTGSIALVLLSVMCFYVYGYFQKKADDQVRLEKFLEDYKIFKPTRFSYVDLKRITSNFKDKLGEGAHGTIFKGNLSTEIQVAVKVLNNSDNDGKDFINEVGTMGKIHHINVVRLLGFCADGCRRALVYDFFSNGSLQKFISIPDRRESFLGWMKLQQIALGIGKGIEYLHQGCDYRILHFDINPRNVLLDHNFTPKISDFGLAKLCPKNQNTVSMTIAKGTLGYIAPEVFSRNFGNVSYKSDIYSYGILLLEMVGGKKNVNTNQETLQVLYPEWIHNLIEGGEINIYVEDEDETKIAKKLAIVGLWCIQWHPTNRPSMKAVIQMLEGEVDKLKLPPTPFDFAASTNTSIIVPTRHLNFELEMISEIE